MKESNVQLKKRINYRKTSECPNCEYGVFTRTQGKVCMFCTLHEMTVSSHKVCDKWEKREGVVLAVNTIDG